MAKLLLAGGADVHARDKFQLTPMMIAASKDNLEMILELEQKGGRVNVSLNLVRGRVCLCISV